MGYRIRAESIQWTEGYPAKGVLLDTICLTPSLMIVYVVIGLCVRHDASRDRVREQRTRSASMVAEYSGLES